MRWTSKPKAIAAASRLADINSEPAYDPKVAQLDSGSVDMLLAGVDIVVDGCDNFATRHVINEWCHREKIPWVYAACVGSYAICMPVMPELGTACLRCLQDELPDPGTTPTCDTGGIIAPAVQLAASRQVAEVLKYLVGDHDAIQRAFICEDLWTNQRQQLDSLQWRDPDCQVCGTESRYPSLEAAPPTTVHLCGRDGYQCQRGPIDLDQLAQQLGDMVERANQFFIRWRDDERTITAFAEGRILVQGVASPGAAESTVDRWLA